MKNLTSVIVAALALVGCGEKEEDGQCFESICLVCVEFGAGDECENERGWSASADACDDRVVSWLRG